MESAPDNRHGTNAIAHLTTAQKVLLYAGSIGPLGFLPASGTVAVAVAGVPLAYLLNTWLAPAPYAFSVALFSGVAVLLHGWGDKMLGESDSRKLVLDELAGFFVAMFMVPWSWPLVVVAFFLERFIDIAKVPPANVIDRKMHSGLGVVLDDLVAGAYTCVILHLLVRYGPAWLV